MKKIAAVVMAVALALSLCGCGMMDEASRMKDICRQMIDAVIAGDAEAGYALVCDATGRQDFEDFFDYMHGQLGGVTEYRLFVTGISINADFSGSSVTEANLWLKCDEGIFVIEMQDSTEYETLEYFNIWQLNGGEEKPEKSGGILL